jgi:hypothetical protein
VPKRAGADIRQMTVIVAEFGVSGPGPVSRLSRSRWDELAGQSVDVAFRRAVVACSGTGYVHVDQDPAQLRDHVFEERVLLRDVPGTEPTTLERVTLLVAVFGVPRA